MNKFEKTFQKGKKLRKKGKYKKSIRHFKKILEQYQENPAFWNNVSFCNNKMGKYNDAIEAANLALKFDGNLYNAIDNLFFAYDQKKNYEKVREMLRNYLNIRFKLNILPKFDESKIKRFETLINTASQRRGGIIRLDPRQLKELGFELNNREVIFKALQEEMIMQGSIDLYKPTLTPYPSELFTEDYIEFQIHYSFKYSYSGYSDKLIDLLKIVLEYYPSRTSTLIKLADAYDLRENQEAALIYYKKILKIEPQNKQALIYLEKYKKNKKL